MVTNGQVYIARNEMGYVKIGSTHHLKTRILKHRLKNKEFELIAIIDAKYHPHLEKFLHLQLKDFQVTREWYKNEKKVISIVQDFLNKHGCIFEAKEIQYIEESQHEITTIQPTRRTDRA